MIEQQGALGFAARIDNSKLISDAEATKRALKGIGESGTKQAGAIEKAFNNAYSMAGMMVMGAVGSVGMLGKTILDVTAKFEKFGVVLRNTLGNDAGDAALTMIANFAATTPFQLDEVTGAFIKMANQGFVPTKAELIKLGDLASSTGKSFDQLAEAVLDAQTGQFERLKEFGIKASQNGDKVTFSFKEQKTQVDNTNSAIQAYILSLGTLSGVAGANEKISASLTGQISNLGDKIAAMYNEIGTANKGILYSAVGGAATLVDNYEAIGEAIGVLIGIYGAYRLAVMFVAREQALMAAANLLVVESNGFLVASEARAIVMAERHVIAQNAVNTSMLANPYVLAAMAVVALGYAIYKLTTLETDLEKSQKALNETVKDYKSSIESENLVLDTMFARLKAAKEGTDEYKAAKDAIFAKYGAQLKSLGDEATALNNVALAYTTIAEEAMKSARARGLAKATEDAANTVSDVTSGSKTNINKLLVDKFGSSKGSELFYKIIPVIEGKEEITEEIQDIIKQFDTTIYTGGGGMFAQNIAVKSNALSEQLKVTEKANAQFTKTVEAAEIAFAGAKTEKTEAVKEFITAEQERVKLRLALVKATKDLNELETKKFEVGKDKPYFEAKKAKETEIKDLKDKLGIKEKETEKTENKLADIFEKSENDILINQKNTRDKNVADDIKAEDDEIKRIEKNQEVLDQIYVDGIKARKDADDQAAKDKEDKAQKDKAAAQKVVDDLLDRQREISQGFFDIADSAGYLSDQIGESNQGLADMLKGVANVAGQMGNLADKGAFTKATYDAKGNQLTGMSKADAASSIIGGATQMIGMFVSQAAKNKQVMADYYASAIKQQNDYNLSLNEQLRLNTEINGSVFFDDFKGKMADASKALKDATDKKNEAMSKFYGSEAIVGKKNVVSAENVLGGIGAGAALGAGIGTMILPGIGSVIGAAAGAIIGGVAGLFAKKKKDIVAPLLETYPLLIDANGKFNTELAKTLVANNQVTESTKAILENVIQWEEAAKAAREQIVAIIKNMAGSLGSDLKNALVDAFEQGTDAAIKFGEAVTGVLEDILSQQIFNAVFGTTLKKLEDDMIASSDIENGGDDNWMDDIQRFLTGIPALTDVFNTTMQGVKDMAKSGSTYTRELTDIEKAQEANLRAAIQAAKDNLESLKDKADMGKTVTAKQWEDAGNAVTETTNELNAFWQGLQLQVATPGFDLFNPNGEDRAGATKGLAGMTQDTGEELNGRFTAIQEHTFRMAEGIDILKSNSAGILDNVIQIKGHTESMQGDINTMKDDIGAVKAGIDTMNLKGIKIRS